MADPIFTNATIDQLRALLAGDGLGLCDAVDALNTGSIENAGKLADLAVRLAAALRLATAVRALPEGA